MTNPLENHPENSPLDDSVMGGLMEREFPGECDVDFFSGDILNWTIERWNGLSPRAQEKALEWFGKCAQMLADARVQSRLSDRPDAEQFAFRLVDATAVLPMSLQSSQIHVRSMATFAETMLAYLADVLHSSSSQRSSLMQAVLARLVREAEPLVGESQIMAAVFLGKSLKETPHLTVSSDLAAMEYTEFLMKYARVVLDADCDPCDIVHVAQSLLKPRVQLLNDYFNYSALRRDTSERRRYNPWFPLQPSFDFLNAILHHLPTHLKSVCPMLVQMIEEDCEHLIRYVSLPILENAVPSIRWHLDSNQPIANTHQRAIVYAFASRDMIWETKHVWDWNSKLSQKTVIDKSPSTRDRLLKLCQA
jgi:hypothetical protein